MTLFSPQTPTGPDRHMLTVASLNMQVHADAQGRWARQVDVLRDSGADVVLLQEGDWLHDPAAARAGTDLAMNITVAPSLGMPTAVAWNPDQLELTGCDTMYAHRLHHGYCAPQFTVPGQDLPAHLVLISTHLNPFPPRLPRSRPRPVQARLYLWGGLGILAGDINCPPSEGPDPDDGIMLPFNKASRTLPAADGTGLRPNRSIAQAIEGRGYLDAGLHLYRKTGDDQRLARTANDDRIDRIYVSDALGPALVDYELLDTPEGASDHHGVRVTLDTDLVPTELLWQYR